MFLITLLPYITLLSGWIYAVAATLLGLRFLYWSIEILREKPDAPMATFKFSITYLMVLFIAMLADHWILERRYDPYSTASCCPHSCCHPSGYSDHCGGFVHRIQQPRIMTVSEMRANGLFIFDTPRDP